MSESSDPRVLTCEGHITVSGDHSGEDRQHFLPVMIGDSREAGVSYILCLRNMVMIIYWSVLF